MNTGRVEALTDGLLAIIITIMVFDITVTTGDQLSDLLALWPVLLSFALSFVYIAIYWNNHSYLLSACRKLSPAVMWGNMHLLFWLSLIPFATRWVGSYPFAPVPSAVYGAVLLMAALAYFYLQKRILDQHEHDHPLRHAFRYDWKGKTSTVLYAVGIGLAFVQPVLSWLLYATVAVLWFVPDSRIARALNDHQEASK
ncbi:TMEM175 family protein [Halomonas sp. LR3S48]|uniref:TMEM175 family protein n=1 Tax=Halomonas sp. LR3S48 TaxID=2982694 RepID=UPI0021E38AC9|nr:TMEM175 family protein [Halomonas sp. LR3S48]UYG03386.1 TMEM175 family protein [Halomonas sp. LR3S48]